MEGGTREIFKYHNIHVVYTKEAETADQYIEKTVHELGRKYQVTVATSDGLEQVIIMGQGASRLSAAGLRELVDVTGSELRETLEKKPVGEKNYLFENLSDEVRGWIEEILAAEE